MNGAYPHRLKVMIVSWYILGVMLITSGVYYNEQFAVWFGFGFFFLATSFVGFSLLLCSAGEKS
jgi:hypothetical protein